ncbi:MAG: RidA family protein [Proteobacteria bacterium]|nr:RidA family protein [Pseudomonadota bacterium]
MKKEILTEKAPKPIGPYSQAVLCDRFLFLSGQIPLDKDSGEIVGKNIEEQTLQVFRNISAILEEAGFKLAEVIKTTIFLKNISDFAGMNKVYESFFNPPYPVRSTVEVSNLPKGALIEIEVVACKD